jgi:hypothetical protein
MIDTGLTVTINADDLADFMAENTFILFAGST